MDKCEKKEYYGINVLKWGMAILITILHLKPTASINATVTFYLTNAITRIAVPTFFCITGFLVESAGHNWADTNYVKRFCVRWGKLYVMSTVLFMPWIIHDLINNAKYASYSYLFRGFIFIRRFFLNASVTPLWFLLAGIYAALILLLFAKMRINIWVQLTILGILTILKAIFGDCYSPIGNHIINIFPMIGDTLRIMSKIVGVVIPESFWAAFYISVGTVLAKMRSEIHCHGLLLVPFVAFLICEVYLLAGYGASEFSKMITLLPCVIVLVVCFSTEQISYDAKISAFLGKQSIYIYIYSIWFSAFIWVRGWKTVWHVTF